MQICKSTTSVSEDGQGAEANTVVHQPVTTILSECTDHKQFIPSTHVSF